MAIPHAQPLDVIALQPLGAGLSSAVTTSLLKTPRLQLMRVVLSAGHGLPSHRAPGEVTVQCLEGQAVVGTATRDIPLSAGQLVMLSAGEPHALRTSTAASLLVTMLLVPHP